jgi:hypothetical protein
MADKTTIDQEYINLRESQLPPDTTLIPPDMAAGAVTTEALAQTRVGEPLDDYDVRSIYDSRPVNGYDFNLQAHSAAAGVSTSSFQLDFIVPRGYIMVPREVHHWFEPGWGLLRSDVQMSLMINGAAVPNNQNVFVGAASDALINFFLPVNELSTFSVRLGVGLVGGNFTPGTVAFVHLYGNLLLKTGKATPFEIANSKLQQKFDSRGPVLPNPSPISEEFQTPDLEVPTPSQKFIPQTPITGSSSPTTARKNPYPPNWASMSPNQQRIWLQNNGMLGKR